MNKFDAIENVKNIQLVLDQGKWPSFHDAEVHNFNIWRGDMRPDNNVWIGPVVEITFELCALKKPYIVVLKFNDCRSIRMEKLNHQDVLYDLSLKYKSRGINPANGEPLPPEISVSFAQAFNASFTFTCSGIEAIERREI